MIGAYREIGRRILRDYDQAICYCREIVKGIGKVQVDRMSDRWEILIERVPNVAKSVAKLDARCQCQSQWGQKCEAGVQKEGLRSYDWFLS